MYRIITLFIMSSLLISEGYAQQNLKLINSYLNEEREKNNWLESDINGWLLTDQYTDKSSGITHIYIQQRHNNIAVYNAISNFAIKENKIIHFSPGIVDHLENKINAVNPSIKPQEAFDAVLRYLERERATLRLVNSNESLNTYLYEAPDVSESLVKIQLVYKLSGNSAMLAWDVSVELKDEPHWWNIRVNALNGEIIDKNDYTVECTIESSASLFATPDYNIFPFPLEAPSFGSRSLISDPSDPLNSPYGWHDVNGVTGEEYSITRGNNVYVYEDADNNNVPGYSPDGGPTLHFDFPYTAGAVPSSNMDASLTNLFYVNNRVHDFLYPLGFDEVAGNFQQNNYGNGGSGNDYVKAEAFDGGGTNNANFSTPPDGYSGRMQMYLWSGSTISCTSLNVASSSFNGLISAITAEFSSIGSITANLILVNDGSGTTTDACSAITNNVAGKIVLIDRGICTFVSKAQAAVAAGAVGVIIANNSSSGPLLMPGTPNQGIPCISISQADGNILKAALLNGSVTATINTCVSNQIDGSFDNGVITHEYCHGVSNRLTGGPSQAGCLGNGEQGGEGWSDWLALIMTIEPGDQGSDSRGIGTFAKGQPTNGPGIRRYPYSTNMSINPQTYGNLALNTEVHAIGEIWCDAIWDMSWFLIDALGFSNDPYNTTAGNTIAIRLVLEGMKLQPCGPGFLDARDAILTADAILYNNAHRCLIWQAFARRGMGFNASQGSANVAGDETENFDLPPYCLPPTQVPDAAFGSDASTISCGGTVKFTDQSVQAFEWLWEFGDMTTSTLQHPKHTYTSPGTYNVKLTVTNPLGTDFIIHTITVNPAFSVDVSASPTTVCSGEQVQLEAVASGTVNRSYIVTGIPYAPLTGTYTTVSLLDDQVSTSKSIGFTFNFFGVDYNNFYISSNGLITFNAGTAAQPVYGEAIPNTVNPNNFIALAWNDLNPQNAGSSIGYFTTGSAPDRKLVVNYNTSHYGGTGYPFVVQAILYEGTNIIEIHTTVISDASSFDESATTTQGVENAVGSRGVPVPGRNGVVFAAANDAFRFTPYIPYTYTWEPGNLDGGLQTVTPASSGAYSVLVSDGTECTAVFNTPSITVNPVVTPGVSISPDISGTVCQGTNIVFTATPNNPGSNPVYQWKKNGTNVGINSPMYSDNALSNSDQIQCELVSNAPCVSGNPAISNTITMSVNDCGITLNLRVYIEGIYDNGAMHSVLFDLGLNNDPTASDSITIQLHDANNPSVTVAEAKVILHSDGYANASFPNSILNGSYYIAVIHRNSIETWSKNPVLFNNAVISFDFTE